MTVKIKVCGVTRPEDAESAAALGADFVGLNFYPPSPRCVALDDARKIARAARGRALLVGVFVNAARAYVDERLTALQLDLLQFHGDEDDADLAGWPVPVIRALRVPGDAAVEASDIAKVSGDFVLIDTFHPRLFGGTGQARALAALRALDLSRVFVSGGLTPGNAAEAAALKTYALDVASGVEAAPGIKDRDLLRSFIANARSADEGPGRSQADAKLSR